MSANFPGARSHGVPQDTEMDVAWQELMAITEMQVELLFFYIMFFFYPRCSKYLTLSQYPMLS